MKEFRIGEPGGRETRQTQCQEAFQSSCMANTGQHFNSSFFCAGSVWWSVLEKLHRSLHCQTHLKTCPFTVGWVVLGKGHEFLKKNLAVLFKRSPTCILQYLFAPQFSVFWKKRGKKHWEATLFSTPSRWMAVGGWPGKDMYPRKQLFKMHLVCAIFALLWFGLNGNGRPDLQNSRMWVPGIDSINMVPGTRAWRGAMPLII